MAAGGLTGAIFKSTGEPVLHAPTNQCSRELFAAGVRPAIATATLMTGAAGIWSFVKRMLI
jgi:hypothetical protein